MSEIDEMLARLSLARPIFHSEADFQHALAWQFHQHYPDARIRLEYRPFPTESLYLDLWVQRDDRTLAIELKYPTRKAEFTHNGETYSLRNQGAQDITRYDFIKDITRLERVVGALPNVSGYAVLLTNDNTYWTSARHSTTVDAAFRLHEGATLSGSLAWASHAGPGTTANRAAAHRLNGAYALAWRDYATIGSASQPGHFRYLALPIHQQSSHRPEA